MTVEVYAMQKDKYWFVESVNRCEMTGLFLKTDMFMAAGPFPGGKSPNQLLRHFPEKLQWLKSSDWTGLV